MTDREAMQAALEALIHGIKQINHLGGAIEAMPLHEAATTLRAALAQPEPQPVARVPKEWRDALRKLAFMARTSGGTAGPDAGLMAALDEAEALLRLPYNYPAADRGRCAIPNPGSPKASAMIDSVLAEYDWPANAKNAARAGYAAAQRLMEEAAAQPQQAAAPTVASVTECEACFTPDVCQLRGTCDHYAAEKLRVAAAQPQQAAQPEPQQVFWLVESEPGGLWWDGRFVSRGIDPRFFTRDPNEAVRFARREDAEKIAASSSSLRATDHIWLAAQPQQATAADALRRDNEALRTVMIAAAEEIHAHWDAHCDAEGYGPANLMHRLEEGIPSEYGYTAGAFAALKAAQADEIAAAVAFERERCAALCEMWNTSPGSSLAKEIRGGAEAGKSQAEPLRRGTTGICSRNICECEREGLGDQCVWLRSVDDPHIDGYPLMSGLPPPAQAETVAFDHGIGADRYKVVKGSFWWHVRIGDGTANVGKFHSKLAAEDMALKLLTAFRDGAFMQSKSAQPQQATGFNPAADCSPFLTQCPRCNNPNGVPCDGGKSQPQQATSQAEPVAWGQLGLRNGRTYLRMNYEGHLYPPPPDVVRNLNLVPLYAAAQPQQAAQEAMRIALAGLESCYVTDDLSDAYDAEKVAAGITALKDQLSAQPQQAQESSNG